MLTFRNTAVAMIVLALAVLILLLFGIKTGMVPLLILAVWIVMLVVGSVRVCSGFYVKAFCRAMTKEKAITLTFDDGPEPGVTDKVLGVLKKYNIKAAFFIIGKKGDEHPEILDSIKAQGHSLGVHSYGHAFFFDLYRQKRMERDLVQVAELIVKSEGHGGVEAGGLGGLGAGEMGMLFRPPYGVTNPIVARVSKKLGYRVIGWSVRSLDTTIKNPERVIERVRKRIHPGAVVLFHDTRQDLPLILERVIEIALEKGYRFVGLEEMMKVK